MEEKQKTLRPEIQLLNRLLAAETSAERKQARRTPHWSAPHSSLPSGPSLVGSGTAVACAASHEGSHIGSQSGALHAHFYASCSSAKVAWQRPWNTSKMLTLLVGQSPGLGPALSVGVQELFVPVLNLTTQREGVAFRPYACLAGSACHRQGIKWQ